MTGDVLGGEDLRAFLEGYFSTWPDIAFRERRVHHTPHLLVNEWTAIATHVKEIRRDGKLAPPTGRVVEWNGVDVMPLENGLVKRKIVYADSLGFLRQIGLA